MKLLIFCSSLGLRGPEKTERKSSIDITWLIPQFSKAECETVNGIIGIQTFGRSLLLPIAVLAPISMLMEILNVTMNTYLKLTGTMLRLVSLWETKQKKLSPS